MKKTKYQLTIDEWRMVIHGLNRLRNDLINEGRYTDFVDEILLKVVNAPTKKVRI
ncbi:MAG: hypothetical protein FWE32_03640 [Oscillospiraceae bacterium]|nr:hypothetical protein [Oscillospiraceae bacterium]